MAGLLWTFPLSPFLVRARLPFVPASSFSTRMIFLLARLYLYMLPALSFAPLLWALYIQPHLLRSSALISVSHPKFGLCTLSSSYLSREGSFVFLAGGIIHFPCRRYHTFSLAGGAVHVRWLGYVARQRCFSHSTFLSCVVLFRRGTWDGLIQQLYSNATPGQFDSRAGEGLPARSQ